VSSERHLDLQWHTHEHEHVHDGLHTQTTLEWASDMGVIDVMDRQFHSRVDRDPNGRGYKSASNAEPQKRLYSCTPNWNWSK
jgi:hypothetical protein